MSTTHSPTAEIPSLDSSLRICDRTDQINIHRFLRNRLTQRAEVGGAYVYSFNNHEFDRRALVDVADELDDEEIYVIPYQVPNVWGYMMRLLPDEIATARHLVYQQVREAYRIVPNWVDEVPLAEQKRAAELAQAEYERHLPD